MDQIASSKKTLHSCGPALARRLVVVVLSSNFPEAVIQPYLSRFQRHEDRRVRALRQLGRQQVHPDPNRTVYYGNQSWEEMIQPWFAVIVDKKVDVRKVLRRGGPLVTGAD